MENLGYLLAAYTVIWAIVFGYLLYLQRKQRRLQRQLDLLEKSLDRSK
jgi:CcmD family protein